MRYLATKDGLVVQPSAEQIESCLHAEAPGVFWVDVERPDNGDFAILREVFDFHALTIEDIRKQGHRPKIDDYAGYAFMVLFRNEWLEGAFRQTDIDVFVSDRYIVTVRSRPDPYLEGLRERIKSNPELAAEKPEFLQFLVLDQMVEHDFTVLDEMETTIGQLERHVLLRPTRRLMQEVYDLKEVVTDYAKYLGAAREVFQHLITHSVDPGEHQLSVYYRDIYEHVVRQHETADSLRDLLGTVMEVYIAGADNRLNQTMKQLTVLAALFLPVTAISGFFGMNHDFLVRHIASDTAFYLTVALMVAVQTSLAVFFWRRGYF